MNIAFVKNLQDMNVHLLSINSGWNSFLLENIDKIIYAMFYSDIESYRTLATLIELERMSQLRDEDTHSDR